MRTELENPGKSRFKRTPQRLAIIEFLKGNTLHPSAEMIYAAVKERFPTTSFATVYNTLQMLHDQGRIRKLTIDPVRGRFDPDPTPHHHLMCVHCKSIVDIHADFGVDLPHGQRHDFLVLGNHIEFYGLCPTCAPQSDDASRRGKNEREDET